MLKRYHSIAATVLLVLLASIFAPPAVGQLTTVSVATDLTASVGASGVQVPIQISDLTGLNLISVDLVLTYNSQLLTATGASLTGTLAEGALALHNINDALGTVNIAMASVTPFQGSGTLVIVQFEADSAISGLNSPLGLQQVSLNGGEIPVQTSDGLLTLSATGSASVISLPNDLRIASQVTTVLVPVTITDVTGLGVLSADLTLEYDTTFLSATGATSTGTLSAGSLMVSSLSPGQIRLVLASAQPLSGSGVLAFINFSVSSSIPGAAAALTLSQASLNQGSLTTRRVNGGLTVNIPPSVNAGPDQTTDTGSTLSFDGSFTDPDTVDTHTVLWNFGDGTVTSGSLTPSNTFANSGLYTVTLTVIDSVGESGADTLTVTVSDVLPVVDAGPDQAADEGTALSFCGTVTNPSNQTLSIAWDFGDGATVADTLTPTHTYADDGVYTVTLSVTNGQGVVASDRLTATVGNVAPVVEAGSDQTVDEGSLVSLAGSVSDPSTDTLTIAWDFGDGTTAADTLTPTHTYADDGVYTVTLSVTDDDGASSKHGLTVTVRNVAPTVEVGDDPTVDEGTALSFAGSFTDPSSLDTHTLAWDLGDGTTASDTLTLTHTYADNGSYRVTLTITDDDGGSGMDTLIVMVNNVSPAADAGPDITVNEGDPISITGQGSDPGDDTLSYAWDIDGDGTFDVALQTLQTTVLDDAVNTLILQVSDEDGGVGTDTVDVQVQNLPPVVDAGADQSVELGETVIFGGSFTDSGTVDTHTFQWDFGDGQTVSDSLTPSHTYATAGSYRVRLSVTDDDAGIGKDSLVVQVSTPANRPPNIVMQDSYTGSEGQSLTFRIRLQDDAPTPINYQIQGLPFDDRNTDASDAAQVVVVDQVVVDQGRELEFRWTPAYSTVSGSEGSRSFVLTIIAEDEAGLQATRTTNLVIQHTGVAPVLSVEALHEVVEAETLSFQLQATDLDGDSFRFTHEPRDLGVLTSDAGIPSSASFTWDTQGVTPGDYTLVFQVFDEDEASDSQEVLIKVLMSQLPAAAPAQLQVGPGADPTAVVLTWPADAEASSYNLYRRMDGPLTEITDLTPLMAGVTGTTASDEQVELETNYWYAITSVNAAGREGTRFMASPNTTLISTQAGGQVSVEPVQVQFPASVLPASQGALAGISIHNLSELDAETQRRVIRADSRTPGLDIPEALVNSVWSVAGQTSSGEAIQDLLGSAELRLPSSEVTDASILVLRPEGWALVDQVQRVAVGTVTSPIGWLGVFRLGVVLPPPPYDLTGDGQVDVLDLIQVGLRFGETGTDIPGDINRDGVVDILDLIQIGLRFGQRTQVTRVAPALSPCPPVMLSLQSQPAVGQVRWSVHASSVADIRGFQLAIEYDASQFDVVSVEPGTALQERGPTYWLPPTVGAGKIQVASVLLGNQPWTQPTSEDPAALAWFTLASRSGQQPAVDQVRLLTAKLADAQGLPLAFQLRPHISPPDPVPSDFQLGPNYPNPFNPETWIPYQLPTSADVRLQVYDTTGQLVRSLDLGYRNAGLYHSPQRAAHWDGHNNTGQAVASGVYFYRIQAGDFAGTRRMIVVK